MPKDKVKIKYEITVKKITKLPEKLNGSTIFILWRRGSRKNQGLTKRALARDCLATWEEKIVFTCSLTRESEADEFDARGISFSLKEDVIGKRKQDKTHSSTKLNLAEYTNEDGTDQITLPLKFKKSKDTSTLVLTIKTQWLKFNDKILKKQVDKKDSSGKVLELDGGSFEAETDPNMSETENSDSEGEGEVFSEAEDDDDDDGEGSGGGGGGASEGAKKKLARLEQEVYERGKMIRQREEALDKLKTKVGKLKQERAQAEDLRKEAERLRQEKADAERARAEAEAHLQTVTGQLTAFREGKGESDVIQQQEDELRKLRQELIEARQRSEQSAAAADEAKAREKELDALRLEVTKLKHELEEKDWNLSVQRRRRGDDSSDTDDDDGMKRSKSADAGAKDKLAALKNEAETFKQQRDELNFLITGLYHENQLNFSEDRTPVPADRALRVFTKWKVFEKGAERGDFLNYLVDAIDASSKRTDKMMTGYWLSIASYIYRSLRLEFGYNHAVASKSGKVGVIGDFAARLQIVIAAIFERLLTSLYTELATVLSIAVLEQPSALSSATKCTLHSTQETLLPILDSYLTVFTENSIHMQLMKQFFSQAFYFINFTLFNTLLNTKRMCTCSNGFQIKLELSQLEQWISKTLQIPEIKSQLDIMAQAANVLVMDKNVILEGDMLKQICPLLTAKQIKRLLELFTPDQLSPTPVPPEVFAKLKKASEGDNRPLETAPTKMVDPLCYDF